MSSSVDGILEPRYLKDEALSKFRSLFQSAIIVAVNHLRISSAEENPRLD